MGVLNGKKIVVILPAYNAALTLERTWKEIPQPLVDEIVLVDDASTDNTIEVANDLGIKHIVRHESNRGYGGNQKTCYREALALGADVVIMMHPDYQYTPKRIPSIAHMIVSGLYPVVLGSRILGNGALRGGMPLYKYIANRFLTGFQNICTGAKLSEYHTGYRAFSGAVLEGLPVEANSEGFIFDNEMLSQIIQQGHTIGELTCPTRYFEEASSIKLLPSIRYGLGVLRVSIQHLLHRSGIVKSALYENPAASD